VEHDKNHKTKQERVRENLYVNKSALL